VLKSEPGGVLRNWDLRAAVRTKPRRVLTNHADLIGDPFPREFAPVLRHPLVAESSPRMIRELLFQYLFAYLTFTDRLEHEAVNQTARRLATGESGLDLSEELRLDCYRVYCDEAYHSLFCADLMQQIRRYDDFQFHPGGDHPGLAFFHRYTDNCSAEERAWFELYFVIVSETLISGVLSRLPQDRQVIPVVRQIVADHAEDEAGHHLLFSRVCDAAWPQTPVSIRHRVSQALPEFIINFLGPDIPALRTLLRKHFGSMETEDILAESYPEEQARLQAVSAARSTLKLFERNGILANSVARERFERYGLVMASAAGSQR
jgi:hypothetical protein